MNLSGLFDNYVLYSALFAWLLAQLIKVPLDYLQNKRWNWGLFFSAGGMPSSHSATMVAVTLSTGLFHGFDNPIFAVGVAITTVVVYDAANVRRQAGIQAQKINVLVNELLSGHPVSEQALREVLGHTPLEVIGGILLGLVIAISVWLAWG
jgi:hypothetical protein